MKLPKLKISGLTRPEDINVCCNAGADCLDFVTEYPVETPWNLTRAEAARLLPLVRHPAKRCILTGGDRGKILALAEALRPDYIQLGYKETLDDTRFLVSRLAPLEIGVIKPIPLSKKERTAQFGTEDLEECARLLSEAGAAFILVDSRHAGNPAGKSKPADLDAFEKVKNAASVPVILAGGIASDSIGRILAKADPEIVGVTTGVEVSPGFKSSVRIEELKRAMIPLDILVAEAQAEAERKAAENPEGAEEAAEHAGRKVRHAAEDSYHSENRNRSGRIGGKHAGNGRKEHDAGSHRKEEQSSKQREEGASDRPRRRRRRRRPAGDGARQKEA